MRATIKMGEVMGEGVEIVLKKYILRRTLQYPYNAVKSLINR